MERSLAVIVQDTSVGLLYQDHYGRFGFRFAESYRRAPDRPILSEFYEQNGIADDPPSQALPPFFANIVPEGQLRRLLGVDAQGAGADFRLLSSIGPDLPGALRIIPRDGPVPEPLESVEPAPPPSRAAPGGKLRFSLAGNQLKSSVDVRNGKVVLPVHGEVGHFIAKFQDPAHGEVPQVEHAVMRWAAESGLHVADTRLVSAGEIDDLPGIARYAEAPALLVKRYDRDGSRRIHAEEFSQVFGLSVEQRYERRGWHHHLAFVDTVMPQDVEEYLRRLLFVVASGNSDAHNKNWSLYYPEGLPRLSPAYDLLCIGAWRDDPDLKDIAPFRFGHSKRWDYVDMAALLHVLEKAGVTSFATSSGRIDRLSFADWAFAELQDMRERMDVALDLGPPRLRAALHDHWSRVPLLRRVAGP